MSWPEYYKKELGSSFAGKSAVYKQAVDYLKRQAPKAFSAGSPRNFVLGGFRPDSANQAAFTEVCRAICPNPESRHILLDLNRQPLVDRRSRAYPYKVQAALENLPFAPDSIDFIFLDLTLDFMNKKQIESFAKSAEQSLRQNGLIVAIHEETRIPFLTRALNAKRNAVPTFIHSQRHLEKAFGDLQVVLRAQVKIGFDFYNLIAFSKKGSAIPNFEGRPIGWDF